MITVQNQTPDFALVENVKEKRDVGEAYLAPDTADDALFVDRDTNTLGDAQSALSVRPGTGVVDGERLTLDSARSVDVSRGSAEPRRDVVYLTTDENGDPVVRVREGDENSFAWGSGVESDEETIANAYRPAPSDMGDTVGLVLAIVHIPPNTTSLQTRAVTPIRASPPAAAMGADGHALSTSTDDFGGALLDVLEDAAPGDIIRVPQHEWTGPHTPVTITTDYLTITSDRVAGRDSWHDAPPRVFDSVGMSGEPFIDIQAPTAVLGITFDRSSAARDGAPAIEAHAPCVVDDVIGEHISGPVVSLLCDNTTGTDNVNNSIVTNISGWYCDDDVIFADAIPEAVPNANALRLGVTTAKECNGWAINLDRAWGCFARVDHAAGTSATGAIRFGHTGNHGHVSYCADGIDNVFAYDAPRNHGEVVHHGENITPAVGAYVDANGVPFDQNTLANYTTNEFLGARTFRGAVSSDSDLTTTTAGDGLVVTTPDGTAQYRIRVDDAGALTTEQL